MKVADAMTRSPIAITEDDTVLDAMSLMLQCRISGLPVVDSAGILKGIVTEGDFLRRSELDTERQHPRWLKYLLTPSQLAREYVSSHGCRVGEVMTACVFTVDEEASLADAVELMIKHHIKRLPVVKDGQLTGILSRADLLRAYVRAVSAAVPGATTDAEIRRRIVAEIERCPWGPRTTVEVDVKEGNVRLRGVILDEDTRTALKVLAENVPGVKSVDDQVVTVEPLSGMIVRDPGSR